MSSSSTSSTTGGARLVIAKQESPEQEAIHKNGENKLLHSVIKNVPFVIDLGLEGDFDRSAINFNRCTLEATLMYDSREDKPVHYVSRRPVEYSCTVDKAAGDKVKVECTLNVLSSQHEGAHFRLRFTAASLALHVLSDPIRVVSKPLQLKKVKEQRKAAAAQAAASSAPEGKTVTGKKRPLSDSIQDTLARIEAQQQAQQTLISSLFQTVMAQLPLTPATSVPNTPLATASPVSSPCSSHTAAASPAAIFAQPATPPAKRRRVDLNTTPSAGAEGPSREGTTTTFESHLRGLIESFHAIAPSHRAQAVHSAVTKATPMQVEKLSGLVDVLCAEGLGRTAHMMISLSAAPLVPPPSSSSTRVPHHPWQLSSASSPLISAGADASDDDDEATASWLSTETSPMSPGDQSASQASTSTFSFDAIEVMFPADGHVASSSQKPTTAMLGDWDHNDAEDEIYNELFSLLDQGEAGPSF